jgi:hypothetical protein
MMDRWIRLLLLVGLLISSLGAIAYAIWIFLGLAVSTRWYWGGAIAAFIGPLSFATAAYLNELRVRLTPFGEAKRTTDA